jgi:UDP-N-acetylmuramoyl-tripeptide--D-alanyl-D-alanine ligase
MGISIKTVQNAVKELKPANMRGEIETIRGRKIIADCYNANPSSMQTSLKMFRDIPASAKRIAVLGTMGELGEYEATLHEELGKSLVNYKIDKLIAVGKCGKIIADGALNAGFKKENVFVAQDAQTAGKIALETSQENDTLLFKGSRSVGLEKAIHSFITISK